MRLYRFVGSAPCEVGDLSFERFGSRAEFTPELARDVLSGGACFIPEDDFQRIGFSEDELTQYAYAGSYSEPTQAFIAKRTRAQHRAIELMANPDILTASEIETTEV